MTDTGSRIENIFFLWKLILKQRTKIASAAAVFGIMILSGTILFLGQSPLIIAQEATPQNVPIVEGTYVSRDGMVELTFQRGWKGIENQYSDGVAAIVTKNGQGAASPLDFTIPTFLLFTSKDKASTSPENALLSDASNGQLVCNTMDSRRVWLNEAIGKENLADCHLKEKALKMKSVTIETPSNWVTAVYVSPTETYEASSNDFSESLRNLKVFNAVDSKLPPAPLIPSYPEFFAAGSNVTLEVLSSSSLSGFGLNAENKQFIATLNETSNNLGVALIPVGQLIEGPYSVIIDDHASDNYEVLYSIPGDEPIVKIMYPKGTHDLSITGTKVVPEFPFLGLGVFLGIMLLSTIIISKRLSPFPQG